MDSQHSSSRINCRWEIRIIFAKKLNVASCQANEEFYESLRAGLAVAGEQSSYSSHLGRAEFGSLKQKPGGSARPSRDTSGDKLSLATRPGHTEVSSASRVWHDLVW